jgi:glycosyltransferase involved in cell wall biosynthesis
MRTVVHLITGLDTGGSETALVRLLSRIDRRRFRSTVISLSGEGSQGHSLRALGVPVVALQMRNGVPGPATLLAVARAVRRIRPDILQTWLYHADLIGALIAPFTGCSMVCWNVRCAELDPIDHSASLRIVLRILAQLSSRPAAVVVNSVAGQRAHQALGYVPRRWQVIPNGFDTDVFAPSSTRRSAFRARLGIEPETPVIGLVARYHPMKDHATFIKAAALVAAVRPNARFVLAGRGVESSNRSLCDALRQYQLLDLTHLCGEVDDTSAVYPAFDVAVASSYSEAFPNVIGEAMACGVPCVTTAVGDAPQLVGRTGFVVPPRNPPALARAIEEVLAMDPVARYGLGTAARARIITEYSLDRAVAAYERLYEQLAEGAQCAA